MRASFPIAGLFTIAGLCLAAALAFVWRDVSRSGGEIARMTTTADFVGQCQTEKSQCAEAVTGAMRWAVAQRRITRACLSKRPSARTMARGTVIWLNAHVELHPLPVELGIARAADAIWPCKK